MGNSQVRNKNTPANIKTGVFPGHCLSQGWACSDDKQEIGSHSPEGDVDIMCKVMLFTIMYPTSIAMALQHTCS